MTHPAFFVTGTDTGVGKTRASCALIHALRQAGHERVVGMKPVAAGCDWVDGADGRPGHWLNEDVAALRAASSLAVPPAFDNPYALPDPLSPHIAARRDGQRIDLSHIEASFHALRQHADAVVVEGAGGFIVPLSEPDPADAADAAAHDGGWATSADLAQRLALPVVLVVGLRLGCLNHALLTQEAILSRGLRLAGWVANVVDPGMPEQGANLATLQARLQAPLLAHFGWDPHADVAVLGSGVRLPPFSGATPR
ncbi:MAG: dethiobiotin synthase [Proteobacteria bacterium]|uniref:dethiobiotin synthase n=1 Tax=Aquabacterium sp. TaxID=1872578 RepID=UPI0035C71D92|nr:dethiobiotin synthase [Pseudomonadota bacterium]